MTNQLKWEKKVWGKVLHVFNSEYAAVSYLVVNEGFQCSRHYHEYRVNQFTVISGRIVIKEWTSEPVKVSGRVGVYRSGTEKLHKTILGPGESYTVDSNIDHRFEVVESGQVVEVYWPDEKAEDVKFDDIVRIDEGGPIEEKE